MPPCAPILASEKVSPQIEPSSSSSASRTGRGRSSGRRNTGARTSQRSAARRNAPARTAADALASRARRTRMLFASYNIQYGTGRDGRVDLARIARAVESADVIALQEVERFTQRTGMVDQPEAIGALLPRFHWTFGPGMDLDADVVAPGGA